MKFSTLLVIALLGVIAWYFMRRPELLTSSTTQDPVAAMTSMASSLPRKATQRGGPTDDIIDVSYDVRKTDSMVNPMIGYLNFTETHEVTGPESLGSFKFTSALKTQFVFHWVGDRWLFSRYICRENDKDFTDLPGGVAFLDSPEISAFLAQYGRVPLSAATPPPPPVAQATPIPITPKPLPREITLTSPITMPVAIGGKSSGVVTLPRGTRVQLVTVGKDSVVVRYVNSTATVPISATDFRPKPQ